MSDADPANQSSIRKRRFPWWLFLFLIIILAGVATGGWFGWRIIWMRMQAQDAKLVALHNSLLSTNKELAKLRKWTTGTNSSIQQQSAQLKTLRDSVIHVRHNVERLNGIVKGARNHVQVEEIAQLLHTANESVELNKDPATARIALRGAGKLLSSLGDPRFFPVQKIIASELVALQAVQKPDITTAALELSQLITQIPQLPIQSKVLLASHLSPHSKSAAPVGNEGWAARSWSRIKRALGALFQVRHSNHAIAPLLTAAQKPLVAEVLSLRLDTARAALVRRNQPVFDAALQSASAWLGRYYESKNDAVSAMQAALANLGTLNLSPKLPSVSRSLEVFRRIKQQTSQGQNNG